MFKINVIVFYTFILNQEEKTKRIIVNALKYVPTPVDSIYDENIAFYKNRDDNIVINNNDEFITNIQFNSFKAKTKLKDVSRRILYHDEIKDNLDKFKMNRRKTYHFTPEFNFSSKIPLRRNNIQNALIENKETNANEHSTEGIHETDELTPQENDIKKMYQLLNKQEDLVRQIKLRVEDTGLRDIESKEPKGPNKKKDVIPPIDKDEKPPGIPDSGDYVQPIIPEQEGKEQDKGQDKNGDKKDDKIDEDKDEDNNKDKIYYDDLSAPFHEIIKSIERLKTSTTAKEQSPSTLILTDIIDETAIRRALRGDPFVQRILRMAKKKREKYFQQLATKKD